MNDPSMPFIPRVSELAQLRGRVALLEASDYQREQTERALRESERRLATLLSNLPGMAYRCRNDAHWTMEFVSEGCLALTGYASADLIENRTVSYNDCILPEDRPLVRNSVDQGLAEGRHFQMEYRIRTARGEVRWVSEQGVAVPAGNGGGLAIEGFIADITQRKEATEALRLANAELERRVAERTSELSASHEQLRQTNEHLLAVYEGMVEGFLIFDIETFRAVRANAALCRAMGYTEEELLALTLEQKHPRESFAPFQQHYETVLREGWTRMEDAPCYTKDGRLLHFEIVAKRILYGGRPSILVFFHDITEHKQALEAVQKERQTLWHLLQASDHERQLIAYEIHDGLAQYLAAAGMQFQTYMLLRDQDAQQAQRAYDAATQLVSQSHFEARRLISGVRPPVLDEAGVETAIAHLVHDERVYKGLKIEFQSEVQFDRLPAVLENALYRIAQEALTNAWKHSQSKKVKVTLRQDGARIRLTVQDWGIGFEPDAVVSGHFGLEGIRERVRLLGGTLNIESAAGKGSRLEIDVPIVERHSDSVL